MAKNAGIPLMLAHEGMRERFNLPAAQIFIASRNRKVLEQLHDRWLVAWMVRAIKCCYHVNGGSTPVRTQCATVKQPIPKSDLESIGFHEKLQCGGIVVPTGAVNEAAQLLKGSGIRIATDGGNNGDAAMRERLSQIESSASQGADDIESHASHSLCHTALWHELYEEVRAMKEAAGDARLGIKLPIELLGTLTNVFRCSLICMMAGADYLTATSIEVGDGQYVAARIPTPSGATLNTTQDSSNFEAGLAILRAIGEYHETTGIQVAFKPTNVRSVAEAVWWLSLVKDVLGEEWSKPNLLHLHAELADDIAMLLDPRGFSRI
eukprot:m.116587 g.116587  ORF g.116587 m.116587 type:complete len:322 (-) comp28518_c0_seq1:1123-2088(-)